MWTPLCSVVGTGGPVYSIVNIPIGGLDDIKIQTAYADVQAADTNYRNNAPYVYGCETNCEWTGIHPVNPFALQELANFFNHQH